MKIKIGILGYGNLGKGIEQAIKYNDDMELVAIFTRRDPKTINTSDNNLVFSVDEINKWQDKIDVLIICGGSATDLPAQTPKYAKMFNVIDSFDTHAKICEHYKNVNTASLEGKKVSLISCGWDPGIFSLNRLIGECFLPNGNTYTFWGKGVSQGHSDAIRRIDGVKNAIQYTIPIEESILKVRNGDNLELTPRQKHLRECFVVADDNANKNKIEKTIKEMPNYFNEYNTNVHFISEEELKEKHSKMPHGGFVIRSGKTSNNNNQVIEYALHLDSNPEFTASVILAYSRALFKLYNSGITGAMTVFDIPPKLLSNKSNIDLLKNIL